MSIPDFPEDARLERYKEERKAEKAVNSYFVERYYLTGVLNLMFGAPIGFLFCWAVLGFWWGVGMATMLGVGGLLLMLISRPHRKQRQK